MPILLKRFLYPLLGVLSVVSIDAALAAEAQDPSSAETVELTVVIVTKDLELRPVPKWKFRFEPVDGSFRHEVATSFEGKATVLLPPGDYLVRSVRKLDFQGKRFSWRVPFSVIPGAITPVELSNDNATTEQMPLSGLGPELTEGELYRRIRPSVMKVISEGSQGTGFLVSPLGLVLTNHHVIANSDYLAVLLEGRRKHTAVLVEADPINDIAVVRIHPDLVHGFGPLNLANDTPDSPPVAVGQRVLAIGSPLATDTILTAGLVSKVEEGAIYSDVAINPGNSGGPLLDLRGQVIGINTFGLQGRSGPGVSGIVRIHLARRVLDAAIEKASNQPPPPKRPLPVASDFRFPAEQLREAALRTVFRYQDYHVEVGKFDLQVLTPVALASLEIKDERAAAGFRDRRTKRSGKKVKPYEPGKDFYEWRKYGGDYKPVVNLKAIPETTLTAGSAWGIVFFGAGMPEKYRFKADFDRMELVRGNTVVEPIHPGRYPNVVNFAAGNASMEDVAFFGSYDYPPEAFAPGATLNVKIWKQGYPTAIVRILPPATQARIWRDFRSYFDSLKATMQPDAPSIADFVESTDEPSTSDRFVDIEAHVGANALRASTDQPVVDLGLLEFKGWVRDSYFVGRLRNTSTGMTITEVNITITSSVDGSKDSRRFRVPTDAPPQSTRKLTIPIQTLKKERATYSAEIIGAKATYSAEIIGTKPGRTEPSLKTTMEPDAQPVVGFAEADEDDPVIDLGLLELNGRVEHGYYFGRLRNWNTGATIREITVTITCKVPGEEDSRSFRVKVSAPPQSTTKLKLPIWWERIGKKFYSVEITAAKV